jgi:opacity protein-like surface antigen
MRWKGSRRADQRKALFSAASLSEFPDSVAYEWLSRSEGVDNRFGWTAGGGVEWAFAELWSARLEYDYYGLRQRSALMTDPINGFTGVMNVQQSVQTVKLGVSFHMWAGQ